MLRIDMEKIDDLNYIVFHLKILVFLQAYLKDDIPEDDYYFENFNLKSKDVRCYLTELIYNNVKELSDLIYADDFYM